MKITAIYGPNASGKTQYVEKMRRQMASDKVRYVAFRDSYGVATDQAYYLQLRWNQHDIDAETPTVAQLLEKAFREIGDSTVTSSPSRAVNCVSSSLPERYCRSHTH